MIKFSHIKMDRTWSIWMNPNILSRSFYSIPYFTYEDEPIVHLFLILILLT